MCFYFQACVSLVLKMSGLEIDSLLRKPSFRWEMFIFKSNMKSKNKIRSLTENRFLNSIKYFYIHFLFKKFTRNNATPLKGLFTNFNSGL